MQLIFQKEEDEGAGGVFSTQVDEETLQAAKDRQAAGSRGGGLFDPENWEATRQTTTMSDLLDAKICKQ